MKGAIFALGWVLIPVLGYANHFESLWACYLSPGEINETPIQIGDSGDFSRCYFFSLLAHIKTTVKEIQNAMLRRLDGNKSVEVSDELKEEINKSKRCLANMVFYLDSKQKSIQETVALRLNEVAYKERENLSLEERVKFLESSYRFERDKLQLQEETINLEDELVACESSILRCCENNAQVQDFIRDEIQELKDSLRKLGEIASHETCFREKKRDKVYQLWRRAKRWIYAGVSYISSTHFSSSKAEGD